MLSSERNRPRSGPLLVSGKRVLAKQRRTHLLASMRFEKRAAFAPQGGGGIMSQVCAKVENDATEFVRALRQESAVTGDGDYGYPLFLNGVPPKGYKLLTRG